MAILFSFIFLVTLSCPAISLLLGEETVDRVPLTEPLKTTDLSIVLDTLEAHNYKGREWQRLCLSLGLTDDTINVIETDHKTVAKCLMECLSQWLRKVDIVNEHGGPNWETLISALRIIGEIDAAEGIDRKKQPACIIFNKQYGRISSSVEKDPITIAKLLHDEKVIDDATVNDVIYYEDSKIEGTRILLKAVQQSIYKNYKYLEKFGAILRKFVITASVGDTILKDYGEKFDAKSDTMSGDELKVNVSYSYGLEFKDMRSKWRSTRSKVWKLFEHISLEEMKDYFIGEEDLPNFGTRENIQKFVMEKSSLIDIRMLVGMVEHFEINKAKPIIEKYQKMVDEFCKNVPLRLSLNETISSYPILDGEKIVIKVDRKIDDKTLKDIDDLLHIAFEKLFRKVKLVVIRESNSFIIVCSFPLILTDFLIAAAIKNIELLKDEGVQQLTIGYVKVYSNNKVNTIEDSNWMRETILDGQHMLQMKSVNAKIKVAQNFEKIEDKLTEHNDLYSYLLSLIMISTTTMVLLFILAYKKMMEKLSLIFTKKEITEAHLLSFEEGLQLIRTEHSMLFNGLDECKAKIKELQDQVYEYLHRESYPTTLEGDGGATILNEAKFSDKNIGFRDEDIPDLPSLEPKEEPYERELVPKIRPYEISEEQITTSFEVFVSQTPELDELTGRIDLGDKWYMVGVLLQIDQRKLSKIEDTELSDNDKAAEIYRLWLSVDRAKPASRKQILEVLRNQSVGKAESYETYLREVHSLIYSKQCARASDIFKECIQSLSESLVSPVQVSQLLYSKGCISEATLDEMERIDQSRSLDDKKTTLLTAIQETVSNDYKKLKDIATVLSDVEETKDIANRIMTEYDSKTIEKIDDENSESNVLRQDAMVDDADSNEDRAYNILRKHYNTLAQSLTEVTDLARVLYSKEIISSETLADIVSTRESITDSKAILLRAVRHAIHDDHKNLEVFLAILLKIPETADIVDTMKEECEQIETVDAELENISEENTQMTDDIEKLSQGVPEATEIDESFVTIHVPNYKDFTFLRSSFADAMFGICEALGDIEVKSVKKYLRRGYPYLSPELDQCQSTDDVLDLICDHCSLTDINTLESIAKKFQVAHSLVLIEDYKKYLDEFCQQQCSVLSIPSSANGILFVINNKVDGYTFNDIRTVLTSICISQNVTRVRFIR